MARSLQSVLFPSFALLAALALAACQPAVHQSPAMGQAADRTSGSKEASEPFEALFTDGLGEWQRVGGDAEYSFEDGILTGKKEGVLRGNAFLVSPVEYSDFVFETEIKIAPGTNSGVQIRSHTNENGRFFGYQVEVDTSERSWSGGIYDEGRRGWIDDLKDNDAGRAAFKNGEWNHYRVEARGNHIQTWVNGVQCADLFDDMDASGFIGFQVHSGQSAFVQWRNPKLYRLN